MIRALRTAALGMAAQQMNVDVVANNLANVNTTGFKKSAVEFQDLLYDTIKSGNDDAARNNKKPGEIQVGMGNRPVATFRSFTQGNVEETGNSLDLAINGNGFIQIMRQDGTIAYSRDGALRVNAEGELVNGSGLRVYPQIDVPLGATSVNVSENGIISVLFPNQPEPEEVGQIELASFMNPAGLRAEGGNLYVETQASGRPNFGIPGEDSFGTVVQGYLEKSNVDVVQEMINLIISQRAYEINSKAVTTSDELLSITNNIKR
ncbi:MAG: flagellar basal-body rod protein FlgG [Candidatus Marinimicrobia bacterium]|nr:flagellar basal-body rod protein FlgG [Candidatus Neomarinimicrobiota bacterium]MCF7841133.1 flagellar basal-body rod protein FlgG [Candidatus Neomarinimicrobiota bacterium]MCF7902392.1 flagellar basal-body rod protein FlgG [Candidatus Neomarinimicrobiota bacterium]